MRPVKAIPRITDLVERTGADALVIMSAANFAAIGNSYVFTIKEIPARQAFIILTRKGHAKMILCSIEQPSVRTETWIDDIYGYQEFEEDPIDLLIHALNAEFGLTSGVIGVESAHIPESSFRRLSEALPDARFVNISPFLAKQRHAKTPAEVERLEFACKATHGAIIEGMEASTLGESEAVMAARISKGLIDAGAESLLYMCFASGPRTPQGHALPSERVPLPAEIIRFDVAGRFRGWMSDFARTYSTGNPTPEQQETYRNVWDIEQLMIDAARPGALAEDVFEVSRAAFVERGMRFSMPHVGHGLGIDLHEQPFLRPGDKTPLEPGMVLAIEPFYVDESKIGYHLEDIVLVTEGTPRLLSLGLAPREIPIVGQPLAQSTR